ncbi:MAG TPA: serine/threonine-protein kinase [Kofleriaceae bacterium]|nr:serine/threonine-protein kinase [Kofleriaceae bacterium]
MGRRDRSDDDDDDPTVLGRPSALDDPRASTDPFASTHHDPGVIPTIPPESNPFAAPPPDAPLRPAGSKIGHYVIESVVGAGGMGVVYAARDRKLGRKVAIKVLRSTQADDRLGARLLREAQAMAKLSHPNVITVYEAGKVRDEIYIAMEYVPGETLSSWLRTPRSWRDVLQTFLGAGRGLEAAHAVGLVHRDFKPDNVLIDSKGRARVTDFGIARQHGDPDWLERTVTGFMDAKQLKSMSLTTTGELIGTPLYMSPEQCQSDSVGPQSDQFSFCLALYEALYGHHPFASASVTDLMAKLSVGERDAPPKRVALPRWLRQAIDRGLSVKPEDRFPSMTALLDELEHQAKQRRDWRPYVAASAAAVIAAGVVAWRIGASPSKLAAADDGCGAAGGELAQVWSPTRRTEIERAFRATKVGFADQAWKTVSRQLDEHVAQLASFEQQACRARDPLRDERMLCIAEHRRKLGALVELFAHADPVVVEHAVDAAQALDLRECTDHRALAPASPLPDEPAAKARVDQARALTANAELDLASGKFAQGLGRAEQAIEAARAAGYHPVLAASLVVGGRLQWSLGHMDQARALFREATTASELGRDDRAKALALTWLVQVVGTELADYNTGAELGEMARAAITRAGGDASLDALLEFHLGMMALKRGDAQVALAHQQKALQQRQVTLGRDHGDVGATRIQVGSCLTTLGRFDEALEQEQLALDIITKRYGAGHPLAATALTAIGNVYVAKGDVEHASASYRDAIQRLEASVGHMHPDVALALANLGAALLADEHATSKTTAEAIAHLEDALAIEKQVFDAGHKEVAETLRNLGRAQLQVPDGAAAVSSLEAALKIFLRHAELEDEVAELRFDLAKAYKLAGRREDAKAAARAAAEAYEVAGKLAEAREVRAWLH